MSEMYVHAYPVQHSASVLHFPPWTSHTGFGRQRRVLPPPGLYPQKSVEQQSESLMHVSFIPEHHVGQSQTS
jgi:hypothetical protein